MKLTIKKIATLAMLAAMAYVVMVFIRIPIMPAAPYLEYDAKDIFFVMAGFLVGPVEGIIVVVLVCLIEMVTVSTAGPIGLLMNVIASLCFVVPATFLYKRKKSTLTAVVGLSLGVITMTGSMILWNYLITPLYTGTPREAIVLMLPTVFLPFNLIKAGINMALTLIIYSPIALVVRKSGLLEDNSAKKEIKEGEKKPAVAFSPIPIVIGLVLLSVCAGVILLIKAAGAPA
ncbi:MAG: ECF transporter S component [Lachnospiraceae bacterium]|nr:ECF transporter S component [Lachnospiraceae bacterium]